MFNKIIMIGHLTKDIEIRYLNTGSALATSSIATNRKFKKQDGSLGEEICYVDFKIFGKPAETASQYLKKGSKVLIDGRLSFETWTDSSGGNRSKHSIMVENIQYLDTKKDSNNMDGYQNYNANTASNNTKNKPSVPEINIDDDMPF